MSLSPLALQNQALLAAVALGPHDSLSDLARAAGVAVGNVNRKLASLEAEGLVRKTGERSHELELTSAGRAAREAAMLLEAPGPATDDGRGLAEIRVELIHKDEALNPRTVFAEAELDELAASLKAKGVLQPILVRPHPDAAGNWRIVAGERRWRAAQRAGLPSIPAIRRDLTDDEALEIAAIENLQRVDLNPMDEAEAYRRILDAKRRQAQELSEAAAKRALSEAINRTPRLIEQRLQLLKLTPKEQARMRLPEDDPQHLNVSNARYALQDHERRTETARARLLAPELLLIMAELVDKVDKAPAERSPGHFGPDWTEIRFDAGGKDLEDLCRRSFIDRRAASVQTGGRSFARLPYYGVNKADITGQLKAFGKAGQGVGRARQIDGLRRHALGDAEADHFAKWRLYATAWLNGPFEPDPALAAQIAEAKTRADQAKALEAEAAANAQATLEQAKGIEETLGAQPGTPLEPLVRRVLDGVAEPAPWRLEKDGQIRAAGGQVVLSWDGWRGPIGPTEEARRRLLVALVNSAAGVTPPKRGKAPKAGAADEPSYQSDLGRQCLEAMKEESPDAV